MILADTGALYALGVRGDAHHAEAVRYFRAERKRTPFGVTAPILTEAAYLLGSRWGIEPVYRLLEGVRGAGFSYLDVEGADVARSLEVLREYEDAGIDWCDAVSLAVCERLGIRSVFTFDRRDFAILRARGTGALRVVP